MRNCNLEKLKKALPKNATQVNWTRDSGVLSFVIPAPKENSNNTITVWINVLTGEAGWEGNDLPDEGSYYYDIETMTDFRQAMKDLKIDFERTWTE